MHTRLFGRKPLVVMIGVFCGLHTALPGRAQTAVDDQLNKAMAALKAAYAPCSDTLFDNCISARKDGAAVKAALIRTINNRSERTDIVVVGYLTAADAQRSFNITADGYRSPCAQDFCRTRTLAAVPGQDGSGVLEAWLRRLDPDYGRGIGILLCGNLTVTFDMNLYPANTSDGEQPLVDATQQVLEEVMHTVGNAISAAGACAGSLSTEVEVTAIEPNVLSNVQLPPFPFKAIIRGGNFAKSASGEPPAVKIGDDLVVADTRFISPTELEVTLADFVNRPEGPRDVVVTNPDNTKGTGAGLFFISGLIINFEVNQGVPMKCTDDHPCISDHNTVIRVKVECNNDPNPNCAAGKEKVLGWLHVFDQNNQPIPGSPFEPASNPDPDNRDVFYTRVLAKGTVADVKTRQRGGDWLNYYFNNEKALPASRYTFKFEIDPRLPDRLPGGVFQNRPQPNEKTNLVQTLANQPFATSGTYLKIGVLIDPEDLKAGRVTVAQALAMFDFLRAAYPLSASKISIIPIPTVIPYSAAHIELRDTIFSTLETFLDEHNARNPDSPKLTHLVYFTSDSNIPQGLTVGCSLLRQTASSFPCSRASLVFFNGTGHMGNIVAHEIGHTYGLGDTYLSPTGISHPSSLNPLLDSCIVLGLSLGCPLPAGRVDTILRNVSIDPSDRNGYPDIESNGKFDFMGNAGREVTWVEQRVWDHLYIRFENRLPASTLQMFKTTKVLPGQPSADLVIISGSIGIDNTASFNPFIRGVSGPASTSEPTGPYTLELRNQNGQALQAIGFDVSFILVDAYRPEQKRTSFSITTPLPVGTARVVLRKGSLDLASRTLSLSSPIVRLLEPNGSETLTGLSSVRWEASDADADSLTYGLFYSADRSEWVPIALGLAETSFRWNTDFWAGSTNGRVMVVANDGANEGTDLSDASFTVRRKPPQVSITSPPNGSILSSGQAVLLRGSAYDFEDGQLSGTNLTFTSDVNEILGQGSELLVTNLSDGVHNLSLIARDKEGNSSVDSVTITVSAAPATPDIDLDRTDLVFGAVNVGESSIQVIYVRNLGNAPLVIASATNTNPSFRITQPHIPLTIPAGGQQQLNVVFAPLSDGKLAGSLVLTADDPDELTSSVGLSGNGILRPTLNTTLTAKELVLSWPAGAANYLLESAPALTAPIFWIPLTNSWPRIGDQIVATLARSTSNTFYRLRKR